MAFARMSDFEFLNFNGFGNASSDAASTNGFFEVRQRQWLFRPAVAMTVGESLELSFGPEIQRSTTDSMPNHLPVGDAPVRLRHVRSGRPSGSPRDTSCAP